MDKTRWNEIQAIILFAVAILIFTSLVTFSFQDLSVFTSKTNAPVKNFAGLFGVYLGAALFFIMGLSAYVIPVLIISWAVARLYDVTPQKIHFKLFGTFFLILASSSIFSLIGKGDNSFRFSLGGIAGLIFSDFLVKYLGRGGAILIIIVLFLLSVLLATEFLLLPFLMNLFNRLKGLKETQVHEERPKRAPSATFTVKKGALKLPVAAENNKALAKAEKREPIKIFSAEEGKREAPIAKRADAQVAVQAPVQEALRVDQTKSGGFKLPGLDLLDVPPPIENRRIKDDLEGNARILEETLMDFDIEAKVVEINKGPVITRYELEPAPGVKIHRITSLSDNIALAMKAQSVRIVAPVPGKGTVGFEVPNSFSSLVYLKDVLDSKEYKESNSKLKLALGKDEGDGSAKGNAGVPQRSR